MARLPRLAIPGQLHQIVQRGNNQQAVFLRTADHQRMLDQFAENAAKFDVLVHAYVLMENHFHLLVEVPKRPDNLPSADVVLAKLARLSGHQNVGAVRQELDSCRRNNDVEGEARLAARYHARMWDLSAFMKLLKQRFSQWYNARQGRQGTLWEERFKSVLVDGAGQALVTMAAYIDLNPVRGGLVKDPKDYRWSGYGEAVAGRKRARSGVQTLVRALQAGREETPTRALELYRVHLYLEGNERRETLRPDGTTERGSFSREEGLQVLAAKGRLPMGAYLRCRVRYFSDGLVFGGREFVEEIFRSERRRFGEQRKDGARRLRGVEDDWYAMRDLRVGVFT